MAFLTSETFEFNVNMVRLRMLILESSIASLSMKITLSSTKRIEASVM